MCIVCDTHIPLFWANAPSRLTRHAAKTLEQGRRAGRLAIADISLWELILLKMAVKGQLKQRKLLTRSGMNS